MTGVTLTGPERALAYLIVEREVAATPPPLEGDGAAAGRLGRLEALRDRLAPEARR